MDGNYTFENEICYTGGIYDWASGQYYLNARYYDPGTGRFLSEDTYGGDVNEPDTLHLYAYCANNPVNYVDPSGHAYITGYPKGHSIYAKTFTGLYGNNNIFQTVFFATIQVDINNDRKVFNYQKCTAARVSKAGFGRTATSSPLYKKEYKGTTNYYYRIAWGYVSSACGGQGLTGYYVLDININSSRYYKWFRGIVPYGTLGAVQWGHPEKMVHTYGSYCYRSGRL